MARAVSSPATAAVVCIHSRANVPSHPGRSLNRSFRSTPTAARDLPVHCDSCHLAHAGASALGFGAGGWPLSGRAGWTSSPCRPGAFLSPAFLAPSQTALGPHGHWRRLLCPSLLFLLVSAAPARHSSTIAPAGLRRSRRPSRPLLAASSPGPLHSSGLPPGGEGDRRWLSARPMPGGAPSLPRPSLPGMRSGFDSRSNLPATLASSVLSAVAQPPRLAQSPSVRAQGTSARPSNAGPGFRRSFTRTCYFH